MKNIDLYNFQTVLKNATDESGKQNIKKIGKNSFKLAMMINEDLINSRITIIDKIKTPPGPIAKEKAAKEEEERAALMLFAELDENKELIIYTEPKGGGTVVPKNSQVGGFYNIGDHVNFEKKLQSINKKYVKTIEALIAIDENFQKVLQEPVNKSLVLEKVPVDTLPEIEDFEVFKIIVKIMCPAKKTFVPEVEVMADKMTDDKISAEIVDETAEENILKRLPKD